jgi:hypothetical protein
MKTEEQNLLCDRTWSGRFYPIGREDLAFAGHLRYSATDGLKLQYAMPLNITERGTQWNTLHGETSSGMPLTLVGTFSNQSSGFAFRHGQSFWTSPGHPFAYLIEGYHFEEGVTFDSFDFEVTGLDDFFFQKGQSDLVRYSKVPIASAECDSGRFDVVHKANFGFLGNDLRAQIHSENEVALDELQATYERLRQKHPTFLPSLRRTLGHFMRFTPTDPLSVADALREIDVVVALLSLLRFSPARLTSLSAIARDEAGHRHSMRVFPYRVDDQDAIALSRSDWDHLSLPLNSGDLSFDGALKAWSVVNSRYSSIISSVQNTTRKVAAHETHATIVLAATQIEAAAIADGEGGKASKYSSPVAKYASPRLQSVLAGLFSCAVDSIGNRLSELRNEIAHVGRPSVHLAAMTPRDLYRIGQCLQLVIAGRILETLSVTPAAREKYQNALVSAW